MYWEIDLGSWEASGFQIKLKTGNTENPITLCERLNLTISSTKTCFQSDWTDIYLGPLEYNKLMQLKWKIGF